jgi:hypothetical protein
MRGAHLLVPTEQSLPHRQELAMTEHPLPKCPRCGGTQLTLLSKKDYPKEPGRRTLYVYKCVCGLSFTSNDQPPVPEPPQK